MDSFADYNVVAVHEEEGMEEEEVTHYQSQDSTISSLDITEDLRRLPRIKLRPDTLTLDEEQEERTLTPLNYFVPYERDHGGYFDFELTSDPLPYDGYPDSEAVSPLDLQEYIYQLRGELFPTATDEELENLLEEVFPVDVADGIIDEFAYKKESGLSEEAIGRNLLSRTSRQEDLEDICSICQDNYGVRELIGKLRCGHEYHQDCIKDWLMVDNSCPLCKSRAIPD